MKTKILMMMNNNNKMTHISNGTKGSACVTKTTQSSSAIIIVLSFPPVFLPGKRFQVCFFFLHSCVQTCVSQQLYMAYVFVVLLHHHYVNDSLDQQVLCVWSSLLCVWSSECVCMAVACVVRSAHFLVWFLQCAGLSLVLSMVFSIVCMVLCIVWTIFHNSKLVL